MRLNRNSAIFIALLAVVIVVALIFLRGDDGENGDQPDIEATSTTIRIFPDVSQADIVSITVSELLEVGDTRPTPIPGNPTLEPATPVPEGIEPEMTTETITLTKDTTTSAWTVDEASAQSIDGTIDATSLTGALELLASATSNRQFTPPDGDYEQYGLDEPKYEVTFVVQPAEEVGVSSENEDEETPTDEPTTYRLRIGNRTVGEGSFYAFLNDDSETIYIIMGANSLQPSILNLAQTVPLEATPTPTIAPSLNVTAPFASFVVTNAAEFNFTNHVTGDEVNIVRNEDNTEWIYTQNGEVLTVDQALLQVILNSFSTISGVDQTDTEDLAALGLDSPSYTFEVRMVDDTINRLQVGDQDPAGTVYYGLVNDFESVVLLDEDTLTLLIFNFDNPPILEPEPTPEVTAEMTPEATEESE